ncbi:MAG: HEAT repeat domain-containing protein [Gemmataceae bacterium]
MFGWFVPKCPVDTRTKAWVESRMLWLADRFGLDRLRAAAVVLPTDEFFPDRYTPDETGCRGCLLRMCGYMGVAPESVHLQIVDDEEMPDAAGLYQMRERSVISLARSQLEDPMRLMATVAHELAHELLLKGGYLTGDEVDHEEVTDLLPVFLGTGIFAANATVKTNFWTDGQTKFWANSKLGYLSSIELGYALAVFAYFRGEDRPRWARHLRTDAALTLRDGLRYLHKTGDALFDPDTHRPLWAAPTVAGFGAQLTHTSPTVRSHALRELGSLDSLPADLLPAVEGCLADGDPYVRQNALRALGKFGAAAAGAVSRLIEAALSNSTVEMRVTAITSLGQIGTDSDEVVPVLTAVIRNADPMGKADTKVVCAAADALARYGSAAESAAPRLLEALGGAAVTTVIHRIERYVAALRAILPDAGARIRSHFANADAEVRRNVIEELHRQERGEG